MSTVYFKEASKTQTETNNIKPGFLGVWGSGVQSQPQLYCKIQVVLHETLSKSKARQKQQCLTGKNILTYRLLEQFWGVANWKNCWTFEISELHTLLMVCNAQYLITQPRIVKFNTLHVLMPVNYLWTHDRISCFAQTHSREFISLNTKDEWSIQVVNYFKIIHIYDVHKYVYIFKYFTKFSFFMAKYNLENNKRKTSKISNL